MIEPSAASTAPQFTDNLLSFGVAYGLGVQGLGHGKVASSLLPPEIAKHAVWRKKRPFFGAAAACLLLAAGAIWIRYLTDMGAINASKGNPPGQVSVDQAEQNIRNDLPANIPAGEYAGRIVAAAEALKREYESLSREGQNEQQTIEQIVKLHDNQPVMLRLYQIIHDALPQVQEPLASAQSPDAYVVTIQANPRDLRRGARKQVFIERLSIRHYEDAYDVTLEDQSGAREIDELEVTDDMNTEGFIVTLECRTPNRGEVKFVSETFMKQLRERGRQPGMGFFVNRVVLPSGQRLTDKPDTSPKKDTRRSSRRGGRRRGGGRGGRPGGAAPPATAALEDVAFVDPVTNESMDRDWVFTIEFDVLLNDAPEPEPEPEQEDLTEG